jgi:hypothetical protein
MQAFLCTHRPRSVNARTTGRFQQLIREAYLNYYPAGERLHHPLYGIVYYFHNKPNQLDADNLSKPIWDALKGLVYDDDLIIQLRHAGVIDLSRTDMTLFDLSKMPDKVAIDFIGMIGSKSNILYVEFGKLDQGMFIFGQEISEEA